MVKASDAVASPDESRERALAVRKWQWLTNMTPSAVDSLTSKGTLPINGDDSTEPGIGAGRVLCD